MQKITIKYIAELFRKLHGIICACLCTLAECLCVVARKGCFAYLQYCSIDAQQIGEGFRSPCAPFQKNMKSIADGVRQHVAATKCCK